MPDMKDPLKTPHSLDVTKLNMCRHSLSNAVALDLEEELQKK